MVTFVTQSPQTMRKSANEHNLTTPVLFCLIDFRRARNQERCWQARACARVREWRRAAVLWQPRHKEHAAMWRGAGQATGAEQRHCWRAQILLVQGQPRCSCCAQESHAGVDVTVSCLQLFCWLERSVFEMFSFV